MRIDKYLQVSGLIKRRVLANEACKRGLVKVNGKTAKATRDIEIGDIIEISLARREICIKVLQEIRGNSLKKSLRPEFYEILKDEAITPDPDLDDFWENNIDED
ncbi:MAG: RNA-binding S4 domain-containing protein [Candidatus Rifleibacteriota bacterium]